MAEVLDLRGSNAPTRPGPVLADPSGRRRRVLKYLGRIAAFLLLLWVIGIVLAGLGILPSHAAPFGSPFGRGPTDPDTAASSPKASSSQAQSTAGGAGAGAATSGHTHGRAARTTSSKSARTARASASSHARRQSRRSTTRPVKKVERRVTHGQRSAKALKRHTRKALPLRTSLQLSLGRGAGAHGRLR